MYNMCSSSPFCPYPQLNFQVVQHLEETHSTVHKGILNQFFQGYTAQIFNVLEG
eukprot:m.339881 g.339881  ORF g.339881 m.339881 type:complete len:54 (+) comp19021_c0_seq1:32-193(+)